jgi:membrane protease YdiL (CAAX protease family)
LIVAYLVLRIPLALSVETILHGPLRSWLLLAIDISMYVVIGTLIWTGRSGLAHFNVDRVSLLIILLFGSILNTGEDPVLNLPVFAHFAVPFAGSVGLLYWLKRSGSFPAASGPAVWIWTFNGLSAGIAFSLLVAVPGLLTSLGASGSTRFPPGTSHVLLWGFMIAMSRAVILEEPVFRGFLWGYLRERGWNDKGIWLSQAALFWLAHLNYVQRPYTFWLVIPLSGLVYGWLAWKSRSIAPSMLAHAVYNSLAAVL